jgi:Rieske 2Fe-2S family protein
MLEDLSSRKVAPMLVTGPVPPAPLAPQEVGRTLAPFGFSRMLPRDAYLDDAVLAWERQNLFGGWVCLGRSADVVPGGLSAESLWNYALLLTRDEAGVLRGFENVCRHRSHELLPCGGSAQAKAIVCPYHAWSYQFDGSLLGAPGYGDVSDFDRAALALTQVEVREWHGWVFVNRTGRAVPFEEHIGELEETVAPYDADKMVTPVSHDYDVAANWKVIIENFQECYHCSMIHPELSQVSPPDSGRNVEKDGNWVGGWLELRPGAQTMSLDGRSGGAVMPSLDEEQKHRVMYVALLPNLLLSLHPDYVMTHLLTPLSPERTRIQCSWAFPAVVAAADDFDPAYAVDFWDLTNRQDWAACESVQRGLRAPHFEPGPLAPAEDGVYQFVTTVALNYRGSVAIRAPSEAGLAPLE